MKKYALVILAVIALVGAVVWSGQPKAADVAVHTSPTGQSDKVAPCNYPEQKNLNAYPEDSGEPLCDEQIKAGDVYHPISKEDLEVIDNAWDASTTIPPKQ